jgi:hypothetical protein
MIVGGHIQEEEGWFDVVAYAGSNNVLASLYMPVHMVELQPEVIEVLLLSATFGSEKNGNTKERCINHKVNSANHDIYSSSSEKTPLLLRRDIPCLCFFLVSADLPDSKMMNQSK